ncbi:MAG: hypothetical protein ACJ0FG_00895 [Gammaproteobacteria bacterium]|tara:strand:+ start:746 stop:1144 length:399 start_codon:yes stop_codon:yes gene_type:complete
MTIFNKAYLMSVGLISVLGGIYMMFSPDVNTAILTFNVRPDDDALAIFVRTMSGLFAAGGYILIRFVFSSSRVQLGTVLIYLVSFMLVGKFMGFVYEGIYNKDLIIFAIGFVTLTVLLIERRKRRNQISYDL